MRYVLGALAALAIGWGLCASTDAIELFPLQAVSGGGSGCLQDSICPSGTWVNDMDEHFTGSSLPSNWSAGTNNMAGAGGEMNCQVAGTMVFNHPGLTLSALPYDTTNNLSNGCGIWSPPDVTKGWSSPGYFEAKLIIDNADQTWNGVFYEFGTNGSCGGDVAAGGSEVDSAETWTTYYQMIYNGYAGCETLTHNGGWSVDQQRNPHIWGVDYGDNGSVTFYLDGVVGWTYSPSDGVEPGTCPSGAIRCTNGNWDGEFALMDFLCFQSYCPQTATNGMKIEWVRHYHH